MPDAPRLLIFQIADGGFEQLVIGGGHVQQAKIIGSGLKVEADTPGANPWWKKEEGRTFVRPSHTHF